MLKTKPYNCTGSKHTKFLKKNFCIKLLWILLPYLTWNKKDWLYKDWIRILSLSKNWWWWSESFTLPSKSSFHGLIGLDVLGKKYWSNYNPTANTSPCKLTTYNVSGLVSILKCLIYYIIYADFLNLNQIGVSQGKQKDGSPFGEYGGWYKACKVDRSVFFHGVNMGDTLSTGSKLIHDIYIYKCLHITKCSKQLNQLWPTIYKTVVLFLLFYCLSPKRFSVTLNFHRLSFQPHGYHHPEKPWCPLQAAGQARGSWDPGGSCDAFQKAGVASG